MVNINYNIPDEMHMELKMKACKERKTIKELIIESLEDNIQKH